MPNININPELVNQFTNKKFLIVIGTLRHLGGAERQAIMLAKLLKQDVGADVVVLAHSGGFLEQTLLDAGIQYTFFSDITKYPKLKKLYSLIKLILVIRRINPDYIIPFISQNSKTIGLIWRYTRAKSAIWNQRDEGRELFVTRWEKFALSNVTHIVSNSYEGKDFIVKNYGLADEKVTVINNGIVIPDKQALLPFWRDKLEIHKNSMIVSMIANITPYKDHKTLLYAWQVVQRYFRERNCSIFLLLAGRYGLTTNELKLLAYELKLCESVFFVGQTDKTNGLINESDLMVHSSNTEGCPNAVLEAMALGKPVIGTDISGIHQALGEKYTQYCFSKPNTPDDLAKKIIHLLENPVLRTEIGSYNLQRVKEEFSVEKMGESYLSLFVNI